ncbi:MAG: aspartate aminotransferase family protein [Sulfolobales archaeon]|nr:aspartate aminotransferase family protein [Sulfolobales archaeon]MCX8209235.1 aspartate aminotransferase family protein [Sulfolobales archaeon]MDW8010510.1 aspartate aminotransferase family protein [Sulfolobales archaeon]
MEYSAVESRLSDLLAKLEKEFSAKTPRSRELFERSRRVLPGGVTYAIRFFKPHPLYIEKAEGTRVWDVDGNEYVDYWMGHGTHILGHSPKIVVDSVREILGRGTHFGYENPYAVEYAELLSRVVPGLEMVRFTNSGTEANMYALRLARAFTRRRYVVKIEGGWHGGYDALHTSVTPPFAGPESAGLPEEYVKYTLTVPYNDVEATEEVLKKYPVAAVFVEPVIGAGGCVEPVGSYLKDLRELTYRYGSLLVFDEVITGFRLAPGGGQEYFDVRADLVVLGKVVGGGFAGAGAFGGRSEVMELLDHLKHPDPRSRSFHGGTFVGNPVNMVAGYALVKYLAENRSLYEASNSAWSEFRRSIDRVCEDYGRACWTTGAGSMVGIHFTKLRPRNVREVYEHRWSRVVEHAYHLHARTSGILYISEKLVHLLPSLVHSKSEIELFRNTFESFLAKVLRS